MFDLIAKIDPSQQWMIQASYEAFANVVSLTTIKCFAYGLIAGSLLVMAFSRR